MIRGVLKTSINRSPILSKLSSTPVPIERRIFQIINICKIKNVFHYTLTRSFWNKLAYNSVGSDLVLCVGHKEYVYINIFVILFEHTSIILCKTFSMGAFYSI